MKNCENPYYVTDQKDISVTKQKEKTQEEIEKCKKDTRETLIQKRHYDIKDGIIGGFVW